MRHSYGHSMHALKSPIVCLIRVRLALLLSPFIKHLSAEEKKKAAHASKEPGNL